MFKLLKENTEEEMIKKEETDLEGEFYYMSTRYKSLIPLINEVKSQRGEMQQMKSKMCDFIDEIDKIKTEVQKIIDFLEEKSKNKGKKK